MSTRTTLLAACCALACLGQGTEIARAQAEVAEEYQVKAVFLYNFAQFVDWPASAFAAPDAPFCIGVLGDDPFGGFLEATVRDERIHNRRFVVEHSRNLEELAKCQMLFISRSEGARVNEILAQLGQDAVLTVSEVDGFARNGGNINFYLDGNRVRFEINPDAARSRGITVSSQLLRLGKIVGRDSGGSGP